MRDRERKKSSRRGKRKYVCICVYSSEKLCHSKKFSRSSHSHPFHFSQYTLHKLIPIPLLTLPPPFESSSSSSFLLLLLIFSQRSSIFLFILEKIEEDAEIVVWQIEMLAFIYFQIIYSSAIELLTRSFAVNFILNLLPFNIIATVIN
jgi:hypothetical protein